MKLTLSIESDNAAFGPDGNETARILSDLAHDLKCYTDPELSGVLRDVNGNTVGSFSYENYS